MATEEPEARPQGKRGLFAKKAKGSRLRSGSNPEKVERSPRDVTGINPRDMAPIDPRMPYIPPP